MIQDGVRWFEALNGNSEGLIDAHFAKGTAHLMKFMKTSNQSNCNSKRSCCSSCMEWRYSEFICSAAQSRQRKASEIECSN